MDYIDSCVFIAAYFPADPNHEKARKYIEKVNNGEITGILCAFGLVEIGGFISRNSTAANAKQIIQELVHLPNLYVWYATDFGQFMNTAAGLAISKGLHGSDALHIVAALSLPNVDRIVTIDEDFKKVSDLIEIVSPN